MLARRIANRYAEALFQLAQQRNAVQAWEQELATVALVFARTAELTTVLKHPEIPLTQKEALLNKVFKAQISPEVLGVLLLLIRRGHDPAVDLLHEIFVALWNRQRRLLPVQVTSAVPMTEEQAHQLANVLAQRTGSTISLQRNVDPELIAGMTIQLGDRVIDASAKAALAEMRAALSGL
ncbi:MAG TPA: ATP synthase F1 subunit delta [Armatimonadota bacterium]|jgi:F-type H+-transporting ATPase subunit delta